jgi:hypothetical protein
MIPPPSPSLIVYILVWNMILVGFVFLHLWIISYIFQIAEKCFACLLWGHVFNILLNPIPALLLDEKIL